MTRMATSLGSALLLIVLIAPATADDRVYNCWAIISSPSIEETGLPDLLTAALSKSEGLKLVERDRLQLATKELELSALAGSGTAGQRLKLGRLLGADALALLSLERPEKSGEGEEKGQEQEERRFVKLVISDCIYGARLWVEFFPYAQGQREQLAARCAMLVEKTRRRFVGGIKQIIGVTHFVSKNLTHHEDHLQAGYAYLLENALASVPGIAVIETEEAQAIGRELRLAGDELGQGLVPLLITGEFETSRARAGDDLTVHLVVEVSDGVRALWKFDRKGLAFAKATDLLAGEIPSLVVRLAKNQATVGISREQQQKLLEARAAMFSSLGAWEHSTGLREAALLLDPNNVEVRLSVIADYVRRQIFHKREQLPVVPGKYVEGKPELNPEEWNVWDKIRDERVALWRIAMRHVETLIRDRVLNPGEAEMLASQVLGEARYLSIPGERVPQEVKQASEEFFWAVYPHFPKLDYQIQDGAQRASVSACSRYDRRLDRRSPPRPPEVQYDAWTGGAIRYIFRSAKISSKWQPVRGGARRIVTYDDRQTLDRLYRVLTEIAPRDMPPIPSMAVVMMSRAPRHSVDFADKSRFTDDQFRAFYRRLKLSDQPLNACYARFGLLVLDWKQREDAQIDEPTDEQIVREADELLAYLQQHGWRRPGERFTTHLTEIRNKSARRIDRPPIAAHKRHSPPRNPIWETRKTDAASGRVTVEPIEDIRVLAGGHLRKCSDVLDTLWSSSEVRLIKEKGAVRTIFRRPKEASEILAVKWDGENFWIATAKAGIYVVAPDGNVIGRVGPQDGLPPYDVLKRSPFHLPTYLLLHPIEPGKCLAVGTFGNHRRLWFAVLSRQAGEPPYHVNVFHEVTKLPAAEPNAADDDPHEIFRLTCLKEYQDPGKPGQRLLLVGRRSRSGLVENPRCPLAIDLATLRVSVFPAPLRLNYIHPEGRNLVCLDGRLLCATRATVYLHSPPDDGQAEEWTEQRILGPPSFGHSGLLIPHEKMVYCPGSFWRRINTQTFECEQLGRASPDRQSREHSVSAHYGLVATTGGRISRVLIGRAEPLAAYQHVPDPLREQHRRAVEAIRKAGGSVGTLKSEEGTGTQVCLDYRWKGGDPGLVHLRHLHNLRVLYLVRVPITDHGLRHLNSLQDLRVLCIFETMATDKGLIHLQGLRKLTNLRLEGPVGGKEFTDAGLRTLRGLAQLKELTLYGLGFTDRGLVHLRGMPNLSRLVLFDTAISKQRLAELKRAKPELSCYLN